MTHSPSSSLSQRHPQSFAPLLDRGYGRQDFLHGLKTLITAAQERIRQEHESGARGRNVVRHLTALVDDVVRTIWQYVVAEHATAPPSCAVLAIGGYGRGELNPFSDVDLMFLSARQPPEELVRESLYLLWDVGYSLGHSVRTQRDVITMAESDLTARTAMLEARFIDGDEHLFRWLREEVCRRRFTPRRRRAFVRQKIVECYNRHALFGDTVNLMEPNVKESPGGLRDYHTTLWIGTALYQADSLAALVDCECLTSDDHQAMEDALDFLFRVRNALHYRHKRKNDLLSVDVQEQLAVALDFQPCGAKKAVEQFLKAYYVHANTVFQSCRTVLGAAAHLDRPRAWRFLQRARQVGEGFVIRHGYLTYDAEVLDDAFRAQPRLLLQTFIKAQEHRIPLAPELSRMLRCQAGLLAHPDMRSSSAVKALFFQILSQPQSASGLRAMHRYGLLSAYIPEFAPLTCLPQYDLYHRYTVDEHTLLSIENLEKLADTRDALLQPLANLYRQTTDKALLKFALLLHDLGKDIGPGQASHVHRSGELAEVVCERMGLTADQRHVIQILTVHHLAMNRLAQRRDLADERVMAELASMVETVPNLEQLYLLTYADTSAVGPDVWTVWKGTLLAELYRRTLDYLIRQRPVTAPSDEALRQRLRPEILALLPPTEDVAAVDHCLDVMPARYLMATPASHIINHIALMHNARQHVLALHAEQHVSAGFSSVTVCLAERRGVFSLIAGALSLNKLNILGAQIYTSRDGFVLDTLQVETVDQKPVTDPTIWQQVEDDMRSALADEHHVEGVLSLRRDPIQERKRRVFIQAPLVIVSNTSSDSHTIIEVQAQDHLGLLYRLTHVLYASGLDIALAKISTEGSKAIDVFYVTDEAGNKLTSETSVEAIRQALLEALR